MTAEMTVQAGVPATLNEALDRIGAMAEALQTMAAILRTTNESMEALRRQVRLLEKVTPAQARAINAAAREKAGMICGTYKCRGCEKDVTAAIRRSIRDQFGISAARELPRCDYDAAMELIGMWEDYRAIMEIRRKKNER